MKLHRTTPIVWRIATVWVTGWERAEEALQAVHHWADLAGGITFQGFDSSKANFRRDVLASIRRWRPHGVILRTSDMDRIEGLRRQLPNIPFVSTLLVPSTKADVCVVADFAEVIALARDHYLQQGMKTLALYCSCSKETASLRVETFRQAVPGGMAFVYPEEAQRKGRARVIPVGPDRFALTYPHEMESAGANDVRAWLKKLPKPVGLIATEMGAAGFLLEQCRELRFRVPQDIQVIGVDSADVCLTCEPHLTGVNLPFARIGERAMETMLRLLRGERLPSRIIPVSGCTLTVRGTTSPVPVGVSTVHRALEIMEAHGLKRLPAARLARLAGIGRTTLYKDVAGATGCPPGRRLKQRRLEKAFEMLGKTTASLAVIAEACGFSSPFSFSRFFKRETGEAPSVYRERLTRKIPEPRT